MLSRATCLMLIIGLCGLANADPFKEIYPRVCEPGVHNQPKGDFAIFVFCDDAAGTNISVFLKNYGPNMVSPYSVSTRFWQDSRWGADVMAYYWVPDSNKLLVLTSPVYGSGSLYALDLEIQKSSVLYESIDELCIEDIRHSEGKGYSILLNNCTGQGETVEVTL